MSMDPRTRTKPTASIQPQIGRTCPMCAQNCTLRLSRSWENFFGSEGGLDLGNVPWVLFPHPCHYYSSSAQRRLQGVGLHVLELHPGDLGFIGFRVYRVKGF